MPDPRIRDDAFTDVLSRLEVLMTMRANMPPDDAAVAASIFARGLGLDADVDRRVRTLALTLLAYMRNTKTSEVPDHDVELVELGATLGLLLAQATGWEPPIPPEPKDENDPP